MGINNMPFQHTWEMVQMPSGDLQYNLVLSHGSRNNAHYVELKETKSVHECTKHKALKACLED